MFAAVWRCGIGKQMTGRAGAANPPQKGLNMTREALAKLPENVRTKVERMKKHFNSCTDYHQRYEMRERIAGYIEGLYDAGIITDRERAVIYIYATL